MTDKCEPGHVWLWLCRDWQCDQIGHVRLWFAKLPTRIMDDYGPGVSAITQWADMGMLASDCIRDLFGDIPKPNTARLVDITKQDWWCPKCKEWMPRHYMNLDICSICQSVFTKSRATVVETIKLEENK